MDPNDCTRAIRAAVSEVAVSLAAIFKLPTITSLAKLYVLVGFVAGLSGAIAAEAAHQVTHDVSLLVQDALFFGIFAGCLGAVMGTADAYFRKDLARLPYGLAAGAMTGILSGAVAGVIAEIIYNIMHIVIGVAGGSSSLAMTIFARTVGWCILGLLIGLAYGIKENTVGDVKYGLIGGTVGGAIGGFLFDPLCLVVQTADGVLGRFVALVLLGMAISIFIHRFRETAISRGRPEMRTQLTRRLPTNVRLLAPSEKKK